MPIQSPAVNKVVSRVLTTPVAHWLLSPGLALVTVTGRKTGRTFTFPVGYRNRGTDIAILVADAPTKNWWRNYHTEGPIGMLVRGRDIRGTAVLVDPADPMFRETFEGLFRILPFLPGQFKVRFDRRTGLTKQQLEELGRQGALVLVTPTP